MLIASGYSEDSYRSWRVYAPGTWLRVEANGSPAVQGEPLRHPKQSGGVAYPFHDEPPAAGRRRLGPVRLPRRAAARHPQSVPRRFPRLRGTVLFHPITRRGAPGLMH